MKTRGIRGGILISLTAQDDAETVRKALAERADLVSGSVSVEVTEKVNPEALLAVRVATEEAGGTLADVRPPRDRAPAAAPKGETVIVARTVRSGGRVESTGSIVVLGDVNAGAELVAADDVIVIGTLRGLAHAGVAGNENAIIWAQHLAGPQLRIGSAVARAEDDGEARGPEIALLRGDQIVVRSWTS